MNANVKDVIDREVKEYSHSEDFNQLFKTLLEKKGITRNELADRLGIKGYEWFRKVLNKSKSTPRIRDIIIASCIILKPNQFDVTNLFEYYDRNLPFLSENDRELFIFNDMINDENAVFENISEINEYLENHRYDGLCVNNYNKDEKKDDKLYEIMNHTITVNKDRQMWFFSGIRNMSLVHEYHPWHYSVNANMQLKDRKNNRIFNIGIDGIKLYCYEKINKKVQRTEYNSIEDTKDLKPYFNQVKDIIKKKNREMFDILNDTKNYGIRSSAKIEDDKLLLFAESFNYDFPEKKEYGLIEYKEGKYSFKVYGNSFFMRRYLSSEQYSHFYRHKDIEIHKEYKSIEEIDEKLSSIDWYDGPDAYYFLSHKNMFIELKNEIEKLRRKLIKREVIIRDVGNYSFKGPDIITYYKVEDEFNCKYDSKHSFICEYKEKAIFEIDGEVVELSVSDLVIAYSLGIDHIESICRIKKRIGEINKILAI